MVARHQKWILCGGLASGKTAVRLLLGSRGIQTIDADTVGHAVIEPGGPAFDEVVEQFPDAVAGGQIDRSLLAGIVFADRAELKRLEAITHPHIFGMIRSQVEDIEGPVVVEMPLIRNLGSNWQRMVVDATEEIRVRRAVERGMTRADALSRLALQPARSEWLAAADLVVPNHGGRPDLEKAVDQLVASIFS